MNNMQDIKTKVGQRIRTLRDNQSLEREDLVKEIPGLSYSALAMYERGERYPDPVTAGKIAHRLGVDIAYIMGISDETDLSKLSRQAVQLARVANKLPTNQLAHLFRFLSELTEQQQPATKGETSIFSYSEFMDTQYRKKVVSDRIKRLREQRGWNQRELARQADVSQKGISSIENLESNRENPRIDTLEKIAQAFGIHLIELVYNLDPELFVGSKEAAQFAREGYKLPSRERAVLFRMVHSLAEQQQGEKEGSADPSEKPLLP